MKFSVKKRKDWKVGKSLWAPAAGRKRVTDAPCLTRYLGLARVDEDGTEVHEVEFRISGRRDKDGNQLTADRQEKIEWRPDHPEERLSDLLGIAYRWVDGQGEAVEAEAAKSHMTVRHVYLEHVLMEMVESARANATVEAYDTKYHTYVDPYLGDTLVTNDSLTKDAVWDVFKTLAQPSDDPEKPHGKDNKGYGRSVLSDSLVVFRRIIEKAVEKGYRKPGPDITEGMYELWTGGHKGTEEVTLEGDEGEDGIDADKYWTPQERDYFFRNAPQGTDADKEMLRFGALSMAFCPRPSEMPVIRIQDLRKREDGRYALDIKKAIQPVYNYEVVTDKKTGSRKRERVFEKWELCLPKFGTKHRRRGMLIDAQWTPFIEAQTAYVKEREARGDFEDSPQSALLLFPPLDVKQSGYPFYVANSMRDRWYRYLDRIKGLRRLHPYGLRHTGATALLEIGRTPTDVAAHLGDSNAMVEKHYGHLVGEAAAARYAALARDPEILAASGFGAAIEAAAGQAPERSLRALNGGKAEDRAEGAKTGTDDA